MSALVMKAGEAAPSTANATQIGGDHYRRLGDVQPWDMFAVYDDIDHFTASAMTYVIRHRHKGGDADLAKAAHWLQKLLEILDHPPTVPRFGEAMDLWGLGAAEKQILCALLTWTDTGRTDHILDAIRQIEGLRREIYPSETAAHDRDLPTPNNVGMISLSCTIEVDGETRRAFLPSVSVALCREYSEDALRAYAERQLRAELEAPTLKVLACMSAPVPDWE